MWTTYNCAVRGSCTNALVTILRCQVDIHAQHGFVTLTEETGLNSRTVAGSPTSVSGSPWQVNAALRSMVYVSAEDWHGWDKISVTITDLGYDGVQPNTEPQTYHLHLSVAAVNDAPILEVADFELVTMVDGESSSGAETSSAFLVPAEEDTVRVIPGVTVTDIDTKAEGLLLSRPDGYFGTLSTDGTGNGVELLAVEPKVELSLSCAYGFLALGGGHGGLETEDGDLDGGGQTLSVIGTLVHINDALIEGIVYTPDTDWSGIDVVKVNWRL